MKSSVCVIAFLLAGMNLSISRADIFISEFRPNPPGADPGSGELVELVATMGETSFSGFWASIEGDSGFDIQNSGAINVTFDANGLATFDTGDIENPAFTFFISTIDYSTATAIGDIDPDNVLDALGIPDQASGDNLYGAALGGADFAYTGDEPQSVFRDGITLEWYAVNDLGQSDVFDIAAGATPGSAFNIDPTLTPSTFGRINPTTVPEPNSLVGLCLIGFGILRCRSRSYLSSWEQGVTGPLVPDRR